MRILFALDKYRARHGGADGFARAVTQALGARGCTVAVLEAGGEPTPDGAPVLVDGVPVTGVALPRGWWSGDGDLRTLRWNRAWRGVVAAAIARERPDWILTQNMLAPGAIQAARAAGVPSLLFFHGYRCLSPTFFEGEDALRAPAPSWWRAPLRCKLKWPWVRAALRLHQEAYQTVDRVVANSGYVAQVIQARFGRSAEVLYPILDLAERADMRAGAPAGAGMRAPRAAASGPILFCKPQRIKGIETLLSVAAILPHRRFLVVGQAGRRLRALLAKRPNVEAPGWVDGMARVYERASLLLAPARIPEPFGRVFLEAGLAGVPAVATAAGGIPEAVGEGGRLVPMDAPPSEWACAVESALDPEVYGTLAAHARAHARALVADHTGDRLHHLLRVPPVMQDAALPDGTPSA